MIRKACSRHLKGTSAKDEVIRWSFPSWPEVEARGQLTKTCTVKQVKQIMMAADETIGKVCIVTPRTGHAEEIALHGSYTPSYSLHGLLSQISLKSKK